MENVVATMGASGVIIGAQPPRALSEQGEHSVHLIMSGWVEAVIAQEVAADVPLPAAHRWEVDDLAAPVASSSRAPEAMVIAPCSVKTMSAVAHGYAVNLIARTAEVVLGLGRPLAHMLRETPLSLPAIENMHLVKRAGAIILPPVMACFPRPQTVDQVTKFFVGKALDALGLGHEMHRQWGESR